MNTENMTEKEAETILRQFSESKQTLHSFFTKVILNDDTTRIGNLTPEELGNPSIEIRTMKELELFSNDICDDKEWANYFKKLSEIQTRTSLSKDGFLLRLSVTSKKELADVTPQKKSNTGWFKKKEVNPDGA